MRLTIDPETGLPFARAEEVHAWRIVLCQPVGRPGRPRVVKGDDGDPLPVAADATEEQLAQFFADSELDISEVRVVAKALDVRGVPMFDREVDIVVSEDGETSGLQADTISEESLQSMARSLVESQKILASVVDRLAVSNERMAESLAGRGSDEPAEGVSALDKIAGLLSMSAQQPEKNTSERDVSPPADKATKGE